MLYTKFVRTNRSNTHERTNRTWHEYAREAKAHDTAHDRVWTRTRHAHASRRFTHDYARIGTARTAAAHDHSRRSQVTGRSHAASTRTRIVRDGITNRTHADTRSRRRQHRCSLASRRYAYESHRHGNTYAGAAGSRQPQLRVAGAGSRSRGRSAGYSAAVDTTRHSTTARGDHARYTRDR